MTTVYILHRQYHGGKTVVGVFEDADDAWRAQGAYEANDNWRYTVTSHAVTPSRAKVATP